MTKSSAPATPLDIIVIGAGLSGLAAAISCAVAGHNVVVLEGAKQLAEVRASMEFTQITRSYSLTRTQDRCGTSNYAERESIAATMGHI